MTDTLTIPKEQNSSTADSSGLQRILSFPSLFFICVANMIGVGIFTTSGYILRDTPNAWTLIACWIFGGIISLCGSFCYCELGAMFPKAGGDYVFLRESLGKRAAFLSGWISLWVGFSAPIAASSMALSTYLTKTLWPEGATPFVLKAIAISVICLFAYFHSTGLRLGVQIQNALTAVKIGIILLFIACGFSFGTGSWESFQTPFEVSSLYSGSFATSLIFVFFAYSGWNASVYLGGEVRDPEKNIPRSMILATLSVVVIYVALNLLFLFAAPIPDLAGAEEIGWVAATHLFEPRIATFFSLAIAFFLLSAISAMVISGPRVYYAMAKDNAFFHALINVSQKHHVPERAILLQAAIAVFFVLTGTFESLIMYIGFILSVFSSLAVIGMMLLRIRRPELKRPYKTYFYPVTPVLYIGLNAWIIFFCVSGNILSLVYGLLTIGLGLATYEYFTRKQS